MKKVWSVLVLICVCSFAAKAQSVPADSVRQLPSFTLQENRFNVFGAGVKKSAIDSLAKTLLDEQSLAQVLAMSSPVFIKNYGPGQLATTSFRGAGAHHTAILWNGINLQSSMNGQTDFNLLPSLMADDVAVSYGGNTALYGGGAVGGAILLDNTDGFEKRSAKNLYALGSYGAWQEQLSFVYGNKRYYVKGRGYWLGAQNDISYRNTTLPGAPRQNLVNASQEGRGSLLETGVRLSNTQSIHLRYWYGFSNRNIPPTIGATIGSAYQVDENHRVGVEWRHWAKKNKTVVRAAWINDYLNYQDPSTYNSGISHNRNATAEVEHTVIYSRNFSLNGGINISQNEARSTGYTQNANRTTTALFMAVQVRPVAKLQMVLNVREELVSTSQWQPFTATLGVDYTTTSWLTLSGQINKSYRLPTLNDLYWTTGNPNLRAETGLGQEFGFNVHKGNRFAFVLVGGRVFNRNITNWIQWQPYSGTWTPYNLKEVWSRGTEWDGKITYQYRSTIITWKSEVSYVLSTNEKANSSNDLTVGKQLIYIPRLSHQHWLLIRNRQWYGALNQTYTGYRFTTADNEAFLDDYPLLNLMAGFNWHFVGIKFQVNNLLDKEYQVLPARPMPGRNYLFTFTLTI